MPSLSLDATVAAELAEMLQFLAELLAADDEHLAASLAAGPGQEAHDG